MERLFWARVRHLKAGWALLKSPSSLIMLLTVFVATVNVHFQQYRLPCHKALIISGWLQEHDSGFTPITSTVYKSKANRALAGRGAGRGWGWGGMMVSNKSRNLLFQSIPSLICKCPFQRGLVITVSPRYSIFLQWYKWTIRLDRSFLIVWFHLITCNPMICLNVAVQLVYSTEQQL